MQITLHCELAQTFSLAAQQNSYPLVKRILISAIKQSEEPDDSIVAQTIRDIRVRLTTEPEMLEPEEWLLDSLKAGQSTKLQNRPLRPLHSLLVNLSEELLVKVTLSVSYTDTDGSTAEKTEHWDTRFLPADYWGGESRQPELLGAFVQPNISTVEMLTSKVARTLRASGQGSAINGYQSNTRERPYLFGSALWSVIFNERLSYLSPPQGWAQHGQRIRTAADILQYKTAACLDTSVLFASCLENMGLNPVIALTKTHAFAGFWLIDESFPVLTNDDPIDLRKRIDADDLVMFETTLVTNDTPVTFNQAIEHAKQLLAEDQESEFVMLIDIKHARARKIKPLATIEVKEPSPEAVGDGVNIGLGTIPPLPPVKAEERVIEETPETRVDIWQRKLLDLTKRNPLLSARSSALKLFCPNLGGLEDQLAAGVQFNFISAEDTGLQDQERSAEGFMLSSGENMHREFAIEQLARKRVIVNDTKRRMDTKLVELLRKAKNDIEEGGSNTLYLAIGMLRWRETPESDKSYRAPLILLPVKLDRRSAQASVTMRQLPDEEPIFNLTLIEMLQTDYDINLDELRGQLPEDDSGVDVHGIWNIVREAIKEQKGFIVVEEVVLGSFSFAKYLMWKDLRDRTELLKKSPFVEHLVDRPTAAYQQETNLIPRDEVDQKISPAEFFAPLNCDSSQMIAVAASAHAQDFVLEGPPGTGKSETIANIICHNLALGRKVLFVAEKMAALQVVYRRMEKIGLAHLCLELHSNKANKKSVLDQLGAAWTKRETASQSDWIHRANELQKVRHHLNRYVSELHHKHPIGFSPRDAMARVVRYQHEHPLRLPWPADLDKAPIKSESEVDPFLALAKEMGIVFAEVADIDPANFTPIVQTEWTNQWRTSAVDVSNRVSVCASQLHNAVQGLLELVGTPLSAVTPNRVSKLASLHALCELVMQGNVDFALSAGGPKRFASLQQTVPLHKELLAAVSEFGHGLKWTMLKELDWEAWITQRDEATGLFGFLKRRGLKKAMMAKGLARIDDLTILESAIAARELLDRLQSAAQDISGSQIWSGVDTDPKYIQRSLDEGTRALALFRCCLSAFSDPTAVVQVLRRQLVDGRDFLTDGSDLVSKARNVSDIYTRFSELMREAASLRIDIDTDADLKQIQTDFSVIADSSEKLSRWCSWLAVKHRASLFGLESMSGALESRMILPQSTEDNALTALCIWLAPILIDRSETLVRFSGASHESTIEKFRELDADVSSTTSEYIAAKAAGVVPDRNSLNTPGEYGVLARELTKKTKHKPVRSLVTEMGASLTNLTPCFMMSPLSVAQFLPADFTLFDLVVFDEASQITTWDAVGAIARGNNVIVVGDPKQMPPSNNFGRKEEEDSDEGDMESILDQALAARLPHLRLTGHYRSRHETLIAFSNSHYYENALTTFPSAETKQSAVTLHRVDGVYAKGKTQTNSIEAQAVVNEVVRRLNGMLHGEPELTLGVVTINSQQQRMVEDFMDEARRKNPELERFFIATDHYDPIFVKNLESVQGDERDIIILSLTYGPTEKGGRTMSMNFGPLNKQGGERRLNVAVTRATTEVIVFSSFDSSMVDLSRTQATAVEHLKNYLEFAERGPVALAEFSSANYGVDQFDSDFEQAVAMNLREKGWKVQTQVGVSKFRVDLGVIHPDHPGRYLAGVECDGATYHGSPSARDRDRVRQAILENLGWRIVRLWSTDYFQEPEYVMRKLHERLESLLEQDRAKAKAGPESVPAPTPQTETETETDVVAKHTSEDIPSKKYEGPIEHDSLLFEARPMLASFSGNNSAQETESLAKGVLADLPTFDKDCYFNDDHRMNLSRLAKSVLELKNGITMHELTLDIAHLHKLSRSSDKQRQHLRNVIKHWAGFRRNGEEETTVWLSPHDVCDEIPWRGLYAFGVERDWNGLCYQEQIGIARSALEAQPDAPVDWLFKEFKIDRRHAKTEAIFASWIDRVQQS